MTETDIRSRPFSLTWADYVAYCWSTYLRQFVIFPRAIFMWLIAVGTWVPLAFSDVVHGHYLGALLIGLGVVAVWCGIVPLMGLWAMRRALARTHTAYLSRIAIVSGPGFTLEGQSYADRRTWAQFRRVIVTKRLIVLSLTAGGGMVVPRAAFDTPVACDIFIAACRRHINGSRHRQAQVFDTPMVSEPLKGSLEMPPYRLGFGLFFMLSTLGLVRTFTRPTTVLMIMAGMIGFPGWTAREAIAKGDLSALWPSVIAFASVMILFPPTIAVVSWCLVRNKPIMRHPRRLSISPDQIRLYGEGFDISTNWHAIRRIDRRFGAVQFWTGPAGSIPAPLSAFASGEDAEAFQRQAMDWWQAARDMRSADI
jgi:hypothetical protein